MGIRQRNLRKNPPIGVAVGHKMEYNSKRMNFGTVGFRMSTKVVLPKMIEAVLENLKKFHVYQFLMQSKKSEMQKFFIQENVMQIRWKKQ